MDRDGAWVEMNDCWTGMGDLMQRRLCRCDSKWCIFI